MAFEYIFKKKEANFGPVIERQVDGGTHISFEIILKHGDEYVALRRPKAIPGHELPPGAEKHPNGLLYFCHGLIRRGESTGECVERIVEEQTEVKVSDYRVVDIWSELQAKDGTWAFTPAVVATLPSLPRPQAGGTDPITEVVTFTAQNVPNGFGWWVTEELKEFLENL